MINGRINVIYSLDCVSWYLGGVGKCFHLNHSLTKETSTAGV